jgi:hypothetical protein
MANARRHLMFVPSPSHGQRGCQHTPTHDLNTPPNTLQRLLSHVGLPWMVVATHHYGILATSA